MTITKTYGRKPRRHAIVDNRPLCGGGHKAKGTHWQTDISECDCERCLSILAARKAAVATFQELFAMCAEFQALNFAGQPIEAKLCHLAKEVAELRAAPGDKTEQADVLILLIACAAFTGTTAQGLVTAAVSKMQINQKRKWRQHEDGTYVHVEESTSAKAMEDKAA
jgi:hypothetical protein